MSINVKMLSVICLNKPSGQKKNTDDWTAGQTSELSRVTAKLILLNTYKTFNVG